MKALRLICMVLVSAALIFLGMVTLRHQSSAAFELGLFLMFAGMFHWVWWPEAEA